MAIGDIGKRIRTARESYRGVGMKQGVLANRAKMSQGRLSQWETGDHDPSDISKINEIANILETTTDYLLYGIVPLRKPNPVPMAKMKVLGTIGAGIGNGSSADEEEIDVPAEVAREDFRCLRVNGTSMEPFLYKGDLAILNTYQGDRANISRAIFIPDAQEWVIKFMANVNGELRPVSANPEAPQIEGEFLLGGFLVGYVRDSGPEREIRLNPEGLQPKAHEKGLLARFLKY